MAEQVQNVAFDTLARLAAADTPIVGIPRPGGIPYAVHRQVLAKLIEGMDGRETTVTLNHVLRIESPRRRYTLRDLNAHGDWSEAQPAARMAQFTNVNTPLRTWAESQRRRRGLVVMPQRKRVPAYLTNEVNKLKRQLAKRDRYGYSWPAWGSNPFSWLHPETHERYEWQPTPEEERAAILAYYQAKPKRKALARITAAYLRRGDSLLAVYAQLKRLGYTYKTFSAQPLHVRRAGEEAYAKHLTRYITNRDQHLGRPSELKRWEPWGIDSLREHTDSLLERKKLVAQIASLEQTIEDIVAGRDINLEIA